MTMNKRTHRSGEAHCPDLDIAAADWGASRSLGILVCLVVVGANLALRGTDGGAGLSDAFTTHVKIRVALVTVALLTGATILLAVLGSVSFPPARDGADHGAAADESHDDNDGPYDLDGGAAGPGRTFPEPWRIC
jgi:hypothetical protein